MASIKIKGQCYKKNSSEYIPAIAEFSANGDIVVIVECADENEVIISAGISEIRVSNKLGNTPRELVFPSGEFFSFHGNETIENWLVKRGNKSRVGQMEKSKMMIVSAMIIVPLMIFLIFTRGIPYAAIEFSEVVPESVVRLSSQQTLISLDNTLLSPSNVEQSKQEEYLNTWRVGLAPLFPSIDKYQLELRSSSSLGANAFALPDGTIVITDELVELMAPHPKAIIAILLHEIGHVEHRHSMRYIAQTLATTMVVNYLLGDVSGLIDLFVGAGATIIGNQFSQELEWQADDYAIAKLTENGQNPESFAQAMELILTETTESKFDKLFSTHPLLRERAEHARAKKIE
jgi:Zn-dependent protease with chaperone function